jgi:hypothetical protein
MHISIEQTSPACKWVGETCTSAVQEAKADGVTHRIRTTIRTIKTVDSDLVSLTRVQSGRSNDKIIGAGVEI